MSQFSKKCTSDFDPFLCFLANYKSWAAHIICLFHVEFDLWYSMVCSKLRYFWLYYMNLLVNGVCLISFFVPLCPAWYFQGVIFSYIGTFFVYYTLMWSLMQGMLILYYGDSNKLAIFWVFLFSLLGNPKMISGHKKHQNSHRKCKC